MKKALLALGLAALLPLTACSSDDKDGEVKSHHKVSLETTSSVKLANEISYVDLTYKGEKPLQAVWIKGDGGEGRLLLEQCLKPWKDGKCEGETLQVLPPVDLAGWQNWLATANTPMIKDQTRYLRVTIPKDQKVELNFNVANDTKLPKVSKKKD